MGMNMNVINLAHQVTAAILLILLLSDPHISLENRFLGIPSEQGYSQKWHLITASIIVDLDLDKCIAFTFLVYKNN